MRCTEPAHRVQGQLRMKIKSYRDVLALVALVGGIVLPAIGFVLFFTDRGSPLIFESIGVTVFLLFWILAWLGLGLAGILRVLGLALIPSGLFCLCMNARPLPSVVCLLVGVACRLAAFWLTRHTRHTDSRKI